MKLQKIFLSLAPVLFFTTEGMCGNTVDIACMCVRNNSAKDIENFTATKSKMEQDGNGVCNSKCISMKGKNYVSGTVYK